MEHVWSHVLGYLYGAYISTAIIAVCLLVYDWRLAIACLWGVPVAFGLLFGSRRMAARASERTKKRLSGFPTASRRHWRMCGRSAPPIRRNGIWKDSTEKLTNHEKVMIKGELSTGLFVNAASVIMRLAWRRPFLWAQA